MDYTANKVIRALNVGGKLSRFLRWVSDWLIRGRLF